MTLAVLAALAVLVVPAIRRPRRPRRTPDHDLAEFVRLVALALEGGATLDDAVGIAAGAAPGPAARHAVAALRRREELDDGPAARFLRVVWRARATGAPMAAAVDRLVADLAAARRADALECARRLPVRLLFPLVGLVLPGFLLVAVGPGVVAGLRRLVP